MRTIRAELRAYYKAAGVSVRRAKTLVYRDMRSLREQGAMTHPGVGIGGCIRWDTTAEGQWYWNARAAAATGSMFLLNKGENLRQYVNRQ